VIPIKDNVPTSSFAVVTTGLIVANVLFYFLYQHGGITTVPEGPVNELAYHPCELNDSCPVVGQDWYITALSSMFMHGSIEHLLGNMLFLWIFGNNVEDALGRPRFIAFYLVGGLFATLSQTIVTLQAGSAASAEIPNVGASGAIAAVLGAYIVLFPGGRVFTWVIPFFFFELPALLFLGFWFLLQLFLGGQSFVAPEATGGVAFFAHIGGFVFGLLAIRIFSAGRPRPVRAAY
jgi:membrane associated rhomboid family serine protease